MRGFKTYRNILCPAKLNLVLRIGPRRPDGYHELESLMVPILWGDRLSLSVRPAKAALVKVKCSNASISEKDNLVTRAVHAFAKSFKCPVEVHIRLIKKVPTGAGLGGGSSDAATVLMLLHRWKFKKSMSSRLVKAAATLGADVPFFLYESAAWCTGFGEKCRILKMLPTPVVIVLPVEKVPTPWAYGELDRVRRFQKVTLKGVPAWVAEGVDVPDLENDFESVVVAAKPRLGGIKSKIAASGARAALMSGSGSAFFGIYGSDKEARKAAQFLNRQGIKAVATATKGF